MASKTPSVPKPAEQSFEMAVERLEVIVEEMESEGLPLEQLLVRYEEGTRLVAVCQEKLESAEKRIEIITRNAAGQARVEPFEPGEGTEPADARSKARHSSEPSESESVSLF